MDSLFVMNIRHCVKFCQNGATGATNLNSFSTWIGDQAKMDYLTWKHQDDGEGELARRLAHCAALLSQVACGVAILEPSRADESALELTMVNEVAACYFGRLGDHSDHLGDAEAGIRSSGIYDIALMVSLTSQSHFQEAMPAPGPAAMGQVVDLAITPLSGGAVSIVLDDVTHRTRQLRA